MTSDHTVFVVDDDPGVVKSLCWLIEAAQLHAEGFHSAEEFLSAYDPSRPGCLILDVRMPGMNGLDLQDVLVSRSCSLPIIVVTGYGDVPACARAFKAGAFDFVEKPAEPDALLKRVREALEFDAMERRQRAVRLDTQKGLSQLTPRERQVLDLLVAGAPLKQVASELAIGVQTATKHRAKILQKLGAASDAELVRLFLATQQAQTGPEED